MLKQRIRALERKLAKELAEVSAYIAARDYENECLEAQKENRPFPDPDAFCDNLERTVGYFRHTVSRARNYIAICISHGKFPYGRAIFRYLIPWSVYN